MMGTVWLRLHPSQEYIQPFVNAIVSICYMPCRVTQAEEKKPLTNN